MKLWIRSKLDATVAVAELDGNEATIGSHPQNHIVLRSPSVPDQAFVVTRTNREWFICSTCNADCRIDGVPAERGRRIRLAHQSQIEIYPFRLDVDYDISGHLVESDRKQLDVKMANFIDEVHITLLTHMELDDHQDERKNNPAYVLSLEHQIQNIAEKLLRSEVDSGGLLDHVVGISVKQAVCNILTTSRQNAAANGGGEQQLSKLLEKQPWQHMFSSIPDIEHDREELERFVFDRMHITSDLDISRQLDFVDHTFWPCWEPIAEQLIPDFRSYLALREIKKQIKDSLFGYGPLQDLLLMPTVGEIMVVSCDRIYVERNGIIENSGRRFVNDEVTVQIIQRIVQGVNRRIDRSQPLVDARLADGSRVNAVIPPLAVSGPCLTIRKFPQRLTMDDLVKRNAVSGTVARFLQAAVHQRCNIIISGGTGTGKTTLLNCLSEFIPDKERIVTVEDTSELKLGKLHVIQLEARGVNVDDKGAYTIRDLVKNALRMRPDRIVIGECRGSEALDMLQAMNTGHDGSLTTLHANNPHDAALRLETLVSTGSDLPISSIRRQITSAIDLIVQIARDADGTRRVSQVTEVLGMSAETGEIAMKDLFVTVGSGTQRRLAPTGYLPSFVEALFASGQLNLQTFYDQGAGSLTTRHAGEGASHELQLDVPGESVHDSALTVMHSCHGLSDFSLADASESRP